MGFEQQIFLSLLGVFVGFALSQSINVVKYLRRPKFQVEHFNEGLLSSYSGNPPETPSEIVLGFFLKNSGRSPALSTRIFISDLYSAVDADAPLEDCFFEFSELQKPIDVIPPGETIAVTLGVINSEFHQPHLSLNFEREVSENLRECIEADTRGKKSFSAKFHVTSNASESYTVFELKFHPTNNEFARNILEDMMN